MVDWVELIPTIVGSGLVIFVLQFVVNQQVLVPNVAISYNYSFPEFMFTNVGMAAATDAVITINWNESITTVPILFSTDFVQNGTIEFSSMDNKSWQVQVPRISPGSASNYTVKVPYEPETLYITYEKGSKSWPPQPVFSNPTNFWIFVILGVGIVSITASFLYRYYKRKYYRFVFLVRVAQDMLQLSNELKQSPYWTKGFWNEGFWTKDEVLHSTRGWDNRNKILRKTFNKTDVELFDQFFSGIVSRDIDIEKILSEYYEDKKRVIEMEYPMYSGKTIKERVKQYSIRQAQLNNIIDLRVRERKFIDDDTKKIRKESDLSTSDQPAGSVEKVRVLSKEKLLEIHDVNNKLRLKADACLQEIHWSVYSVSPDDFRKVIEHWYTARSIVPMIGIPLGIAVVFLIYYILNS